jgi:hypothetical protein
LLLFMANIVAWLSQLMIMFWPSPGWVADGISFRLEDCGVSAQVMGLLSGRI